MNIGILSMQKVPNYGSFLQAFALKNELERLALGGNVYFIDIEEGMHLIPPAQKKRKNLLKKLDKYALKRIENLLFSMRMDKIHKQDYTTYLQTDKRLPDSERFDLVVIGSDEVFNAGVSSKWGFSTQLFGNVKRAKWIITYAASCGQTTKSVTDQYGMTLAIKEALEKVSDISVRDQGTYDLVYKITGRKADRHIDPVFLANFNSYIPTLPKRKPYLLLYAYVNRINDEREIRSIREFAIKYDLEILSVGTQQRWCKNNITASAFELLAYVRGAAYIVTDTFHGSVFSIKYNKPFAAFIRESNKNKLGDLLCFFGLMDRVLCRADELEKVLQTKVDYNAINTIIDEEKQRADLYLQEAIKVAVGAAEE